MNILKIVLVFTAVVAATLAIENSSTSIEDLEEESHDLDFAESSVNIKRAIADYGSNKYASQHEYNRYEPRSRKFKSRNRRRKYRNKNKKSGFRYNSYQNKTKTNDLEDRNLNIENQKYEPNNYNFNLSYANPNNENQKTVVDDQKFKMLEPDKGNKQSKNTNKNLEQPKEVNNGISEKPASETTSVIENTTPKQKWSTSVPYLVSNTDIKEHNLVSKKTETNGYTSKPESKKFEPENKPQSQQEITTLDYTKTGNNKSTSKTKQPIVTSTEHRDLELKNDNFSKVTNKESIQDESKQLVLKLKNITTKPTSSDSQMNMFDSTAKKTENSIQILPPDSSNIQLLPGSTKSELTDNTSIPKFKNIVQNIHLADSEEFGHKQENVEQGNKKTALDHKISNKQNFENKETQLKKVNTEMKYQPTESTPRKADKSKNKNSEIRSDHTEIRTEPNIQKLKRETTTSSYEAFQSEPSASIPTVKFLEGLGIQKTKVEYKNVEVDKKYNKHGSVQRDMQKSKPEIKGPERNYHNIRHGFKQSEPKLMTPDSASRNLNFEEVFLELRTPVPENKNIKLKRSEVENKNSESKINGLKTKSEEYVYEIVLPDAIPGSEAKKPKPEYIKPNSISSKISKQEVRKENKNFEAKIKEPETKIRDGYDETEVQFDPQLKIKKSDQDAKTREPQNKKRTPEFIQNQPKSQYINRKPKPEYTRSNIETNHSLRQTKKVATENKMTKTDNIIPIPENRISKSESKVLESDTNLAKSVIKLKEADANVFNYKKVKFEQDQMKDITLRPRTDAKSKSVRRQGKRINSQYRTSDPDSRYHKDKQVGLQSEYINPSYSEYITSSSNYKHRGGKDKVRQQYELKTKNSILPIEEDKIGFNPPHLENFNNQDKDKEPEFKTFNNGHGEEEKTTYVEPKFRSNIKPFKTKYDNLEYKKSVRHNQKNIHEIVTSKPKQKTENIAAITTTVEPEIGNENTTPRKNFFLQALEKWW